MTFFCVAMPDISQDDALGIEKGVLGETKGNMVFSLDSYVFGVIPIKLGTFHDQKVTPLNDIGNIIVWPLLWSSFIPQRGV
jgi:hypothetical protein